MTRLHTRDVEWIMRAMARAITGLDLPVVEKIAEEAREDAFRVLIATILSARTQDATTAAASDRLFRRAPDARRLAALPVRTIATCIYPVSFYRTKARHVKATCRALLDRYDGRVGMHVNSKTIANWTWETFWWQPGADAPDNFPGSKQGMTDNVAGAWRNYAMCTAWNQTKGNGSSEMVVCFNPYLETSTGIPAGLEQQLHELPRYRDGRLAAAGGFAALFAHAELPGRLRSADRLQQRSALRHLHAHRFLVGDPGECAGAGNG